MLHKIFSRTAMPAMLLTGFLLIGSATPLQAYSTCAHRIQRAQQKLEKAIRRHGANSAQAERRRDELARARAQCQ